MRDGGLIDKPVIRERFVLCLSSLMFKAYGQVDVGF